MGAEVWVRNPDLCIRECAEERVTNIVWDRGLLVKKGIDPVRFVDLYYQAGVNPRILVIGNADQGADEYDRFSTYGKPVDNFPVWCYGDSMAFLEETLEHQRFVVVTNTPEAHTTLGRKFFRTLRDVQEEYPDSWLHIHGIYSYRVMFGLGFKSVDIEPRTVAKKGRVILPPGRDVTFERAGEMPHWVNLLGMQVGDLRVPRNRCIYNIRSAKWAAENFMDNVKFRTKSSVEIEPQAYTDPNWKPTPTRRVFFTNKPVEPGDKFLCDTCSLQLSCRYFRTGSVCSVPDSEPAELARFFKTRDSDTIIDGLGTLLAANTRRLARGMEDEDVAGKLDPEVTKIFKHIFDQGVKLAKLVNPALARAGAANFQFNQNVIQASNPQQLMAAAVAALEARGVHRDAITAEMIQELITADSGKLQQRAIEVSGRAADG